MSTRMRWDKRRPVYRPWYDQDVNPFEGKAVHLARHGVLPSVKKAKKPNRAKPKPALVRMPEEQLVVAAGTLAPNHVLRTGDIAKARETLSGVVEAAIWCDGSAAPKNPGIVGAGAVILAGRVRVELHRGGWHGSNNMAELEAAVMALEALPDGCRVVVTSDSQYLIFGMQKWRHNWRARDFKKNGADMPNADRWRKLDALASERSIAWQWIRGHAGNAMNELADKLAALGRSNGPEGVGL